MATHTLSQQQPLTLVEHTTLPKITVKAQGGAAQIEAYVNAYIVGQKQTFLNGQFATPLYYLSLIGMKGQGTTLQGIFARLVSTHAKGVSLEGVGDVCLAHHQSALNACGYTLHWNYEQAEVVPSHDLHAVIESNMLTICDPTRGMAVKQREMRTMKGQTKPGKQQKKERASLSTVKQSKTQNSLSEIRNREKHPMFLLLVPGWCQHDPTVVQRLHLSFLDPRIPWPLDPSWASFLWERGITSHEIERLKVWCSTPSASGELEGLDECAQSVQEEQVVPFLAEAYFCRPKPAQMQHDLQEALASGRLATPGLAHLLTLPQPEKQEESSVAAI